MKKFYFFYPFISVLIFLLTLPINPTFASEWCTAGKPVKFAVATWDSAAFYTEIAQKIISLGFDCKIEIVTGSKNVTETALVAGDLQVWMEQWQGQNVITKKAEEAGQIKLIGDLLKGGTLEGWFVPDYLVNGDDKLGIKASAPDLKSVSDLVKYKSLFTDPEDKTKGRFLNCPTGWECEKTNSQKLKAYKLGKDYTNFHPGTGGALDAEINSVVSRGKPILFYYWSPSSILGKFKFYQLQEPAYNEQCWKTLFNTNTDSACGSAYPSTKLVVAVSTEFYKKAPDLIDFLAKIQITPDVINKAIAAVGDKKITIEQAVNLFLKENSKIWQNWLPENVGAKVKLAIK